MSSITAFHFYQCPSCGEIFHSKEWDPADTNTAAPCCGASGELRPSWPAASVARSLSLILEQDLNDDNQRSLAVVMLASAAGLLFEHSLWQLLLKNAGSPESAEMVLYGAGSLGARISLFDKLNPASLKQTLERSGLTMFLGDWTTLQRLRDRIVRKGHYVPGSEEEKLEEIDVITGVQVQCLKAFSIITNEVTRHKRGGADGRTTGNRSTSVLVVDDEEGVRLRMAGFISDKGIKVFNAASGEEAIALYKQHRPDCVFLDVMLPGMDGLQVLGSIKEFDPQANVYFITGVDGYSFKQEAQRLGASGHFLKPVRLDDIFKIIKNI